MRPIRNRGPQRLRAVDGKNNERQERAGERAIFVRRSFHDAT